MNVTRASYFGSVISTTELRKIIAKALTLLRMLVASFVQVELKILIGHTACTDVNKSYSIKLYFDESLLLLLYQSCGLGGLNKNS